MPNTLLPGSTRCYPLELPPNDNQNPFFSHGSNKEPTEWQKFLYKKKYQLDERIGSASCIIRSSIVVTGGMVLNILDSLVDHAKKTTSLTSNLSKVEETDSREEILHPNSILTSSNIQNAWFQYALSQRGPTHTHAASRSTLNQGTSSSSATGPSDSKMGSSPFFKTDNEESSSSSQDSASFPANTHMDMISDCISNQVFQLDLITRKWTHITTYIDDDISPLMKPRMCHSIIACDDKIYCFGGLTPEINAENGNQVLSATNELWELDLNTKMWVLLNGQLTNSVIPRRYNHSMHIIHEKKKPIHLDSQSNLELNESVSSSESPTPDPNVLDGANAKTTEKQDNEHNSVEEYTKKLVILGGLNNLDRPMNTIDVFNLETQEWESTEGRLYANLGDEESFNLNKITSSSCNTEMSTANSDEKCNNDNKLEKSTPMRLNNDLSFAFSKNKLDVASLVVYRKTENNPLIVFPLNSSSSPKKHKQFDILSDDFDSKLKSLNRQLRFPMGGVFGLNLIICGYCQFKGEDTSLSNRLNNNIIYPKTFASSSLAFKHRKNKPSNLRNIGSDNSESALFNTRNEETSHIQSVDNNFVERDEEFLEFRSYCYNILTGKWVELNTSCIDKEICPHHLVSNSFIWESHHKALFIGSKDGNYISVRNSMYAPLLQKFDHLLSIGLTVTSLFHQDSTFSTNVNLKQIHDYLLEDVVTPNLSREIGSKDMFPIFDSTPLMEGNYSNLKRYKEYADYSTPTSNMTANSSVLPPYAMVLGKASLSTYADKVSDIELVSSDDKSTWCSLVLLRKRWGRYFDAILAQGYTAAVNEYDTNSGKNSKFSSVSTTTGLNASRLRHLNTVNSMLKERQVSKSTPPNISNHSATTINTDPNKSEFQTHIDVPEIIEDNNSKHTGDDFSGGPTDADDRQEPIGSPLSRATSSTPIDSLSSSSSSKRQAPTTSSTTGMVFRVPFHENSSTNITNDFGDSGSTRSKNVPSRRMSRSRRTSATTTSLMHNSNNFNNGNNISPHSSREPSVSSEAPSSLTSNNLTNHNNLIKTHVKPLASVTISTNKLPPQAHAPTSLPPSLPAQQSIFSEGNLNTGPSHFLNSMYLSDRRRSSINSIDLISEKSSLRNSPFGSRRSSIDRVFLDRRRSSLSDLDHIPTSHLAGFNSQSLQQPQHKRTHRQKSFSHNESHSPQRSSIVNPGNTNVFANSRLRNDSFSAQVTQGEKNQSFSTDTRSLSSATFDSTHSITSSINSELEPLMIPRLLYMPWTHASVDAFVEFFYTGQVNPKWPLQPVSLDVFVMAKLYEVPLLYDLMSEVIYSIIGKKEASLVTVCENLKQLYLKAADKYFKGTETPEDLHLYLKGNSDYQDLLELEKSLKGVDDGYLDYDLLKKASRAVSISTDDGDASSKSRSTSSRFSKGSLFSSGIGSTTGFGVNQNDYERPIFRKSSSMRFGSVDSNTEIPGEFANVSPKSSISKPSSKDLKLTALKNVSSQKTKNLNLFNTISKIEENSDENFNMNELSKTLSQDERLYDSSSSRSSLSSSSSDSLPDSQSSTGKSSTASMSGLSNIPTQQNNSSFKDKYGFGLVSINKASRRLQQQYVEESIDPLTPVEGNSPFPKRTGSPRGSAFNNDSFKDERYTSSSTNKTKSRHGESKLNMLTLEMLASPGSKSPVEYIMELIYDTTVYLYDISLMVRCRNCIELTKSLKSIRARLNHEIVMLDTYAKSQNQPSKGVVIKDMGKFDNIIILPTTPATPVTPTTPITSIPAQTQADPKLLKILLSQQHKNSITSVSTRSSVGSSNSNFNYNMADIDSTKSAGKPPSLKRANTNTGVVKNLFAESFHNISDGDSATQKNTTVGGKLSEVAHHLYPVKSTGSNSSSASKVNIMVDSGGLPLSKNNSQTSSITSSKKKSSGLTGYLTNAGVHDDSKSRKKGTNSIISFFSKKKSKSKNDG